MTEGKRQALAWLERQQNPPQLLAVADPAAGVIFDHWVPDNDNLIAHRKGSIRRFKPILHGDRPVVHYIWAINSADQPPLDALDDLTATLGWLGWAIDFACATVTLATVELLESDKLPETSLSRFEPIAKTTRTDGSLRVAKPGTTAELERLYTANRTSFSDQTQRRKKRWPKVVDRYIYSNANCPPPHPFRLFELRNLDGSRFRYSHRNFIHIAGMVRHLAIEAMQTAGLPRGVANDWIETYIAGHKKNESTEHRQLSYVPLPSVGHEHADPGIRRVMIVAPLGDDALLDHVARRLAGQQLEPVHGNEFEDEPPLLVPLPRSGDGVMRSYTDPANVWHSFTPVILPGHDDHKPAKTRKLIEKALAQSGIEQPCEFEWNSFSRFSKSFSAHKYDRQGRPTGYIRPGYLLNQTAVHLTLRFQNGLQVPGPITLGAGRHCGFGLMAAVERVGP